MNDDIVDDHRRQLARHLRALADALESPRARSLREGEAHFTSSVVSDRLVTPRKFHLEARVHVKLEVGEDLANILHGHEGELPAQSLKSTCTLVVTFDRAALTVDMAPLSTTTTSERAALAMLYQRVRPILNETVRSGYNRDAHGALIVRLSRFTDAVRDATGVQVAIADGNTDDEWRRWHLYGRGT